MAIVRDLSGNNHRIDDSFPSLSTPALISMPVSFTQLRMIPDDPSAGIANMAKLNAAIAEYNELRFGAGDWHLSGNLLMNNLNNKLLMGNGPDNSKLIWSIYSTLLDTISSHDAFMRITATSFADPASNITLADFSIEPSQLPTLRLTEVTRSGFTATFKYSDASPAWLVPGVPVIVSGVVESQYNNGGLAQTVVSVDAVAKTFTTTLALDTETTPGTFSDSIAVASYANCSELVCIGFNNLVDSQFENLKSKWARRSLIWGVDADNIDFNKIVGTDAGRLLTLDGVSNSKVRAPVASAMRSFCIVVMAELGVGLTTSSTRAQADSGGNVISDGNFFENQYVCIDIIGCNNNVGMNNHARDYDGIGFHAAFQQKGTVAAALTTKGNKFIGHTVRGYPMGFQNLLVGGGLISGCSVALPTLVDAEPFALGISMTSSSNVVAENNSFWDLEGPFKCVKATTCLNCTIEGVDADLLSGGTFDDVYGVELSNGDNCQIDRLNVGVCEFPLIVDSGSINTQLGSRINVGANGHLIAGSTTQYPVSQEVVISLAATGKHYITFPAGGLWLGRVESLILVPSTVDTAIAFRVGTLTDDDKFVAAATAMSTPNVAGTRQGYTLLTRDLVAGEVVVIEITGAGDAGSSAMFAVRGFYRL